jgi:hypothetical protein
MNTTRLDQALQQRCLRSRRRSLVSGESGMSRLIRCRVDLVRTDRREAATQAAGRGAERGGGHVQSDLDTGCNLKHLKILTNK